jgi:hypothetical protein
VSRPTRGWGLAVAALAALLASALPARAVLDEFALRAAFLFNFARFVEWPAEELPAGSPLRLCVVGGDAFDGALESLVAGERVGDHGFEVVQAPGAEESEGCNLLYVSERTEPEEAAALFEQNLDSVLTVGEDEAFLRRGGLIRFYRDQDRLRFEVNARALARSRLHISSKLLRLAVMVNP